MYREDIKIIKDARGALVNVYKILEPETFDVRIAALPENINYRIIKDENSLPCFLVLEFELKYYSRGQRKLIDFVLNGLNSKFSLLDKENKTHLKKAFISYLEKYKID